jgi:hypothetical protein
VFAQKTTTLHGFSYSRLPLFENLEHVRRHALPCRVDLFRSSDTFRVAILCIILGDLLMTSSRLADDFSAPLPVALLLLDMLLHNVSSRFQMGDSFCTQDAYYNVGDAQPSHRTPWW